MSTLFQLCSTRTRWFELHQLAFGRSNSVERRINSDVQTLQIKQNSSSQIQPFRHFKPFINQISGIHTNSALKHTHTLFHFK